MRQILKSLQRHTLPFAVLPLFFFSYLKTFWPVYGLIGFFTFVTPKKSDLKKESVLLKSCLFILSLKLIQSPSIQTLIFCRQIFGLYLFYYFFRYKLRPTSIQFSNLYSKTLLSLALVAIWIEFILHLPTIITEFVIFSDDLLKAGYYRPNGFGENATITSVILITFLIELGNRIPKLLQINLAFATAILGSGLGFLGLGYAALVKVLKQNRAKKILPTLFIAALVSFSILSLFQSDISDRSIFFKISPKYITHLIEMKKTDLRDTIDGITLMHFLIGQPLTSFIHYGSDFGWHDAFRMTGFLGFIFNVALIFRVLKNNFARLFLFISIFHYSALVWPASQVFLGYLGSLSANDANKEESPEVS